MTKRQEHICTSPYPDMGNAGISVRCTCGWGFTTDAKLGAMNACSGEAKRHISYANAEILDEMKGHTLRVERGSSGEGFVCVCGCGFKSEQEDLWTAAMSKGVTHITDLENEALRKHGKTRDDLEPETISSTLADLLPDFRKTLFMNAERTVGGTTNFPGVPERVDADKGVREASPFKIDEDALTTMRSPMEELRGGVVMPAEFEINRTRAKLEARINELEKRVAALEAGGKRNLIKMYDEKD